MGATHPAYNVHWYKLFITSYVDTDNCIIWPFSKVKGGYGQLHINNKMHQVHRLVLAHFKGDAPTDKHMALHDPIDCSNPSCINPKHLRWGTHKENVKDRELEGISFKGTDNKAAKLTEEKVLAIRQDERPYHLIMQQYNISKATVSSIKTRRTWKHLV